MRKTELEVEAARLRSPRSERGRAAQSTCSCCRAPSRRIVAAAPESAHRRDRAVSPRHRGARHVRLKAAELEQAVIRPQASNPPRAPFAVTHYEHPSPLRTMSTVKRPNRPSSRGTTARFEPGSRTQRPRGVDGRPTVAPAAQPGGEAPPGRGADDDCRRDRRSVRAAAQPGRQSARPPETDDAGRGENRLAAEEDSPRSAD